MSDVNVNWKDIKATLEHHDYPGKIIADLGGIPQNTVFEYVSDSFLSGIINHLEDHSAYLINRYGITKDDESNPQELRDIEDERKRYEKAASLMLKDAHFKPNRFDDCIMFAQSDTTFYVFWYDCDNSDCIMMRIRRSEWPQIRLEELAEIYMKFVLSPECPWGSSPERFAVKIKRSNFGWIS